MHAVDCNTLQRNGPVLHSNTVWECESSTENIEPVATVLPKGENLCTSFGK